MPRVWAALLLAARGAAGSRQEDVLAVSRAAIAFQELLASQPSCSEAAAGNGSTQVLSSCVDSLKRYVTEVSAQSTRSHTANERYAATMQVASSLLRRLQDEQRAHASRFEALGQQLRVSAELDHGAAAGAPGAPDLPEGTGAAAPDPGLQHSQANEAAHVELDARGRFRASRQPGPPARGLLQGEERLVAVKARPAGQGPPSGTGPAKDTAPGGGDSLAAPASGVALSERSAHLQYEREVKVFESVEHTGDIISIPQGYKVTQAWYGDKDDHTAGLDVTAKVLELLGESPGDVRASNDLFGDPAPKKQKTLIVRAAAGGAPGVPDSWSASGEQEDPSPESFATRQLLEQDPAPESSATHDASPSTGPSANEEVNIVRELHRDTKKAASTAAKLLEAERDGEGTTRSLEADLRRKKQQLEALRAQLDVQKQAFESAEQANYRSGNETARQRETLARLEAENQRAHQAHAHELRRLQDLEVRAKDAADAGEAARATAEKTVKAATAKKDELRTAIYRLNDLQDQLVELRGESSSAADAPQQDRRPAGGAAAQDGRSWSERLFG